jgi:proline iminopeptidase
MPHHRRLFDQTRFRAVLFDQRGAGRSRYEERFRANTTDHLVADIELIRETLGIERWIVVGGSWGATLALAYAERHPDRVLGILMRAVFLATRAELEWAFIGGPARFRPELLADFLGFLPEAERAAPLEAYYRRILDPDPEVHGPASLMWHDYERILSEIKPSASRLTARPAGQRLPSSPFLEAHYFSHDAFLGPDELAANAHRLPGIPGAIVQSRLDMLCPPAAAHRIAAAWPDVRLEYVEAAGHSQGDPGVTEALVRALNTLADTVSGTASAAA